MSQKNRRVVLAFYSGNDGYAQEAYHSLRRVGVSVRYVEANGKAHGSVASRYDYASIRLADEALVIAEAEPAAVPDVVKTLRVAGEPSIFLARQEPSKPSRVTEQ